MPGHTSLQPTLSTSTTVHVTDAFTRVLCLNKVVVLMNHLASTDIFQRGYSCYGCGSRENNIVAGSINKGDRLNVWCIKCFVKAHCNNNSLPISIHVPYPVLNHVKKMLICHDARPSSIHHPILSPPDHGGCSGYCSHCNEMDIMLSLWIPEVKPWYSVALDSKKSVVGLHAPVVVGFHLLGDECIKSANHVDENALDDEDDDKTIPLPEGLMFRYMRNVSFY